MDRHIHGREDVALRFVSNKLFLCASALLFLSAQFSSAQTEIVEVDYIELDSVLFYELEDGLQTEQEQKPKNSVAYKPLEFDGADHELVEKWRKSYSSDYGKKWIADTLSRAENFHLYVRKKINERNLPSIIEYLPLVESGYTINALSKSGALGMWQFMENSIKPFMTKTDFVDERLDPWKATDAALSKLQDNYNMFGDWLLAIAAYNCGAGAMRRALNNAKVKNFWYLAENNLISNEAKNYVPKLLALADLIENSEYYNLPLVKTDSAAEDYLAELMSSFDYITVNKSYSIRRLAAEMRMDENTLVSLNSALTHGITPPSGEYAIRLPLGMAQSALDALAVIEPSKNLPVPYIIKQGDTLWNLARSHKTTVSAICAINGISEKATLQIGKVLYLPQN